MSESLRDQLLKAGFNQSEKTSAQKTDAGRKEPAKAKDKRKKSSNATGVYRPGKDRKADQRQRYRTLPAAKSSGLNDTAEKGKSKKPRKAPAVKPREGSWSSRSDDSVPTDTTAEIESGRQSDPQTGHGQQPDKLNRISQLVKNNAVDIGKAESTYRFTLQKRICELRISENVRQQLASSKLGITILNGDFFVIPLNSIDQIKSIDPQWTVFLARDSETTNNNTHDSGYDDFPVPDDLIW